MNVDLITARQSLVTDPNGLHASNGQSLRMRISSGTAKRELEAASGA